VHGHEGIVIIRLEKTHKEKITEMELVFLEIEGKLVPFFISESEYNDSGILKLKFDGYDSIEKVSQFTGCRVFLNSEKKEDITTMDFRGFKVYLKDNTLAGTIRAIIDNPGQWILNIETENGKELLVPFHEDFILSSDSKKKIIVMDLPDGLTEMN
jgi:16S rRNA processing protein RimM